MHKDPPPYTGHSMNMEQKGTFCSQELLVLVEDWRGRWRQTDIQTGDEIKGIGQDMLSNF